MIFSQVVVASAVLAAAQSHAAPLQQRSWKSNTTIGMESGLPRNAVTAGSGTVGAAINHRELQAKLHARSVGGDLAGNIASGAANSLATAGIDEAKKILRRELEAELHARGVGSQIAGGVASGAAGSVLNAILRRELEAELTARGMGSAIGKSLLGGAGSAVLGSAGGILGAAANHTRRHFVGSNISDFHENLGPDIVDARGIGSTIGKGAASGAGGAVLNGIIGEALNHTRRHLLPAQTTYNFSVLHPPPVDFRTVEDRGIGSTLGKGALSGVGGAPLGEAGDIVSTIANHTRRLHWTNASDESGLEDYPTNIRMTPRGMGSSLGKGVLSGVGGSLLGNAGGIIGTIANHTRRITEADVAADVNPSLSRNQLYHMTSHNGKRDASDALNNLFSLVPKRAELHGLEDLN